MLLKIDISRRKGYNRGMDIQIDRAAKQDIPRIKELLLQVNNVHAAARPDLFRTGGKKYSEETLEDLLCDASRPVFAARRNGRLIGYVFCISQTHNGENETPHTTLYIDDLCVDEAERGQGTGHALYAYAVDYARKNGYYNVTLNVWEGNETALRFYRSLGMNVQKYGMEHIL